MHKVTIYGSAQRQLEDVWLWTHDHFGAQQANTYIDGLVRSLRKAAADRRLWRNLAIKEFKGVYFIKHERHFIFFRELLNNSIGIISVLHEVRDIPSRLRLSLIEIEQAE